MSDAVAVLQSIAGLYPAPQREKMRHPPWVTGMNVLLLSMPDSFEHMPSLAIRMPNGALASLAGNVDPHHHVAIADLILVQDRVRETVEELVRTHDPDVVGLSIMTFQRRTALQIVQLLRRLKPSMRIVAGTRLAVRPMTNASSTS